MIGQLIDTLSKSMDLHSSIFENFFLNDFNADIEHVALNESFSGTVSLNIVWLSRKFSVIVSECTFLFVSF